MGGGNEVGFFIKREKKAETRQISGDVNPLRKMCNVPHSSEMW